MKRRTNNELTQILSFKFSLCPKAEDQCFVGFDLEMSLEDKTNCKTSSQFEKHPTVKTKPFATAVTTWLTV